MKRCFAQWGYSAVWILAMAILQACAPLTNGAGTSGLGNCLGGITTNNGSVGIGQLGSTPPGVFTSINTDLVAQSFPASSSTSFTQVSLNIDLIAPANTTSSGGINVDIEPDAAVPTNGSAGTATTPGGSGTSLGTASLSTLGPSTLPTYTSATIAVPTFVTFTFPSSISLTVGHVYWIVATPTYSPSQTIYVQWAAATSALTNQVADYFSAVSQTWINVAPNVNMDFKVGC